MKNDQGVDTSHWATWVSKPVLCALCGQKVLLRQSHRQEWDELTQTGRVVHVRCPGWVKSASGSNVFFKVDP